MKHRMVTGVLAAAVLAVAGATAGEGLKSGPQVGDRLPGAFHPLNVTGSKAGNKHCLV